MKTVLCFGDSNTHGAAPMTSMQDTRRHARDDRWPGVVQRALAPEWTVIEEGLPGRTSVHDDPIEGVHKNGLAHLQVSLESHAPLDLVAVMLGTNDLKRRFSVSAEDVALSIAVVATAIRRADLCGTNGAPQVLLIAPPPIREVGFLAPLLAGGAEKSRLLAGLYQEAAAGLGIAYLDAGAIIRVSDVDGLHFEREEHHRLGEAVARKVRSMFPA